MRVYPWMVGVVLLWGCPGPERRPEPRPGLEDDTPSADTVEREIAPGEWWRPHVAAGACSEASMFPMAFATSSASAESAGGTLPAMVDPSVCNAALSVRGFTEDEQRLSTTDLRQRVADRFCDTSQSESVLEELYTQAENTGQGSGVGLGLASLSESLDFSFNSSSTSASAKKEEAARFQAWQRETCREKIGSLDQRNLETLAYSLVDNRASLDSWVACLDQIRRMQGQILGQREIGLHLDLDAARVPSVCDTFHVRLDWKGTAESTSPPAETHLDLTGAVCRLRGEVLVDSAALDLRSGAQSLECVRTVPGPVSLTLNVTPVGGRSRTVGLALPRTCAAEHVEGFSCEPGGCTSAVRPVCMPGFDRAEMVCEGVDRQPKGTECAEGRACDAEGRCRAPDCAGEERVGRPCRPEPDNVCIRGRYVCDPSVPGGRVVCGEAAPEPDGTACPGPCNACRAGTCIAPDPRPAPTATVTLSGHLVRETQTRDQVCAPVIRSPNLNEVRIRRPVCTDGSALGHRCRRGNRYASIPVGIWVPKGGGHQSFVGGCFAETRGPGAIWNRDQNPFITARQIEADRRLCVYWAGSHSHSVKMCSHVLTTHRSKPRVNTTLVRNGSTGRTFSHRLDLSPDADLHLNVRWSDGYSEPVRWGASGRTVRIERVEGGTYTFVLDRPPPPLCEQ